MVNVREKILKANNIPTLSPVVLKVIEIVGDENSSIEDLTRVIEQDAGLTVKILQVVNSSFYSFSKRVYNIKHAASMIGMNATASLALSVAVIDIFKEKYDGYDFVKYWEKSLFTAICAKLLAKKIDFENIEIVYIAGLLAHICDFFLIDNFPREFQRLAKIKLHGLQRSRKEIELFGMTHSEMSSLILQNLNFPDIIWYSIKYHQAEELLASVPQESIKKVSQLIFCASKMTAVFYDDLMLFSKVHRNIEEMLGLEKNDIKEVLEVVKNEVEEAASFFGFSDMEYPSYFEILEKANHELMKINLNFERVILELKQEKEKSLKFSQKLEETNKKLLNIALKDPLTGAYNRRYLNEILEVEISQAKRYNTMLLIIACDIDHFKKVNDTYGHNEGDLVLKSVVRIIKSSLRKTDILARTGGEEFIIVCHSINGEAGNKVAEKLRKKIEETPIDLKRDISISITMSFGVACYSPAMRNIEEFIKVADNRLYLAKERGRNRVVCSD